MKNVILLALLVASPSLFADYEYRNSEGCLVYFIKSLRTYMILRDSNANTFIVGGTANGNQRDNLAISRTRADQENHSVIVREFGQFVKKEDGTFRARMT